MRRMGVWQLGLVGGAAMALGVVAGCDSGVEYTPGETGGDGAASSSSSSSSSNSSSTGMGGSGGVAGTGGIGGTGGGVGGSLPACPPGKPVQFAVDQVFLGDTDADGTPNPTNGWKSFGMNIDGRTSIKSSTDLCKPAAGGTAASVYPDGNNGIDNSFGKNILPILLGLASDLSVVNNEAIAKGQYTYLLEIAGADQTMCTTQSKFFLGGDLGQPPKFDGSDLWPVDQSSLVNPMDPTSAKCFFKETRLEGTFVQTLPPSQLDLVLPILGFAKVPIQVARLSFTLSPDHTMITGGQIGGVIETEAFVAEIAKVAAAFDASFCDPQSPTLISILNQLRQASDIMADGTQDPSKTCDGITIGLGFTMKPVQIGNVAPVQPPPPDPCMP